jgi:phasin family protein
VFNTSYVLGAYMINPITPNFAALNKIQLQSAVQTFMIAFGTWEMLFKLNVEATKSLLQEAPARAQGLTEIRDPAALSAWTTEQWRAGAEKVSGYSRNVYEIFGQTSGGLGNLLEQTLLSSNAEVMDLLDEALKGSAGPQQEATAVAAKAAMANTKSVIEGISKAVRQTAGYADANVRAAAAATAEAVKGTAK